MSGTMVDLGEQLVELLHGIEQTVDTAARELIVFELYRRHTVSSGKAAELLGMDRFDFIQTASRLGIPFFDLPEGEILADLNRLATE